VIGKNQATRQQQKRKKTKKMDREILLRNSYLEAVVLPEVGGGLARFDWTAGGERLPLMRPLAQDVTQPEPKQLACFPLVPFSNRIGGGSFEFQGKRYSVERNRTDEPYPIHGDGWLAHWRITQRAPDAVTLRFIKKRTRRSPYSYRSILQYSLRDRTLRVDLSVENTGLETLPYGLGLHPSFPRSAKARLEAPAQGFWSSGKDLLPVAREKLLPDVDFSAPHTLPARLVDNVFYGWNGEATIAWPQGLELRISTEPPLEYFVLFTPLKHNFFCFEPVTHPNNAFNFPGTERGASLVSLAPGTKFAIAVSFLASRVA
jgi:aldose 1-epimerase